MLIQAAPLTKVLIAMLTSAGATRPLPRPRLQALAMSALPVLAVAGTLGALALLPVFPHDGGVCGDLVLLVALLEIPPLCAVLAGFVSQSLYGELGATREPVLKIAHDRLARHHELVHQHHPRAVRPIAAAVPGRGRGGPAL